MQQQRCLENDFREILLVVRCSILATISARIGHLCAFLRPFLTPADVACRSWLARCQWRGRRAGQVPSAAFVITLALSCCRPGAMPAACTCRVDGARGDAVTIGRLSAPGLKASALPRPDADIRAGRQTTEFRFVHSITWSARTRTIGDSSIPKALAMRRLILRSNLVGRSKGKSLGFVPFRTRSTCEIK